MKKPQESILRPGLIDCGLSHRHFNAFKPPAGLYELTLLLFLQERNLFHLADQEAGFIEQVFEFAPQFLNIAAEFFQRRSGRNRIIRFHNFVFCGFHFLLLLFGLNGFFIFSGNGTNGHGQITSIPAFCNDGNQSVRVCPERTISLCQHPKQDVLVENQHGTGSHSGMIGNRFQVHIGVIQRND